MALVFDHSTSRIKLSNYMFRHVDGGETHTERDEILNNKTYEGMVTNLFESISCQQCVTFLIKMKSIKTFEIRSNTHTLRINEKK